MVKFAVVTESLSKRFRIYHERNQSIKQAILRRSRGSYEEFWALRDVSIEVPEGATYGFIGENGSGKSTLLKCIAKILVPNSGSIRINGTVSALLELGAGFHPELSGRENVFLNGAILGIPAKELSKKFDEIVSFAGIERFIDNPVKNYSSGMYVRLGFSVAINVSPDILVVDEVLAVGDAEFQHRCMSKFRDLQASGTTILLVTHSMGMIEDLCHAALWLEEGRVKSFGHTNEVVKAYMDSVEEQTGEIQIPRPKPVSPQEDSSTGDDTDGPATDDTEAESA